MTELALVIVGDEAYLPGELCTGCGERPTIARGLCPRCYQREPDQARYRATWKRRDRIARLEARIGGLRAELAALRSEDSDLADVVANTPPENRHPDVAPNGTKWREVVSRASSLSAARGDVLQGGIAESPCIEIDAPDNGAVEATTYRGRLP